MLPEPEDNETYSNFLIRFIADFNAILYFPNIERREAVAQAIFNTR